MLSRAKGPSWPASRLSAPLRFAGIPGIVPVLKAYSGFRIARPATPESLRTLGRLGALEVRLARNAAEIRRAQKLRYSVFYREMSAVPDAASFLSRRDVDPFDAVCDHLLVVDHAAPRLRQSPAVVGTYRLLRQEVADRQSGFYSAGEFDVDALLSRHSERRFLELGRSCVLAPYRNKRTVELLWHGIWTYVLAHRIDVMIGCASLEGTDPDRLALPLSFLHHYARAPEPWRAAALPRPLCRSRPDAEIGGEPEGGAAEPAAPDQGLSADRRLRRRRRGGGPPVRHHRRADRPAGGGNQFALSGPFRARSRAPRRLTGLITPPALGFI